MPAGNLPLLSTSYERALAKIPPLPLRSELDADDFLRNMAAVAGMAAGCEDARHFPAFYCGLRPWAPESAGLEPTDCAGTGIGTLSRRGLPRGLGGGPWPPA